MLSNITFRFILIPLKLQITYNYTVTTLQLKYNKSQTNLQIQKNRLDGRSFNSKSIYANDIALKYIHFKIDILMLRYVSYDKTYISWLICITYVQMKNNPERRQPFRVKKIQITPIIQILQQGLILRLHLPMQLTLKSIQGCS